MWPLKVVVYIVIHSFLVHLHKSQAFQELKVGYPDLTVGKAFRHSRFESTAHSYMLLLEPGGK